MIASLARNKKPLIVMPDIKAKQNLCQPNLFRIIPSTKKFASNETALLVLPLSALGGHKKKEFGLFKAVFIQSDVNANAILDKPGLKNTKSKFYIFDKWQELNRILLAWHDGVEDETIATAWVEIDNLIVKSCATKRYSISFKNFLALAKIAVNDRTKFRIHEFGNYLYWPNYDVHLNIESIKYNTDKKYREKKAIEQVTYDKDYGQAIAELRKRHGLTQQKVQKLVKLSARQLYRVESIGHRVTINILEKLATAHQLELNDYLKELAEIIRAKKSAIK